MNSRQVTNADFAGKTVSFVNTKALNVLVFFFTDGSIVEVESVNGPHGIPTFEVVDRAGATS